VKPHIVDKPNNTGVGHVKVVLIWHTLQVTPKVVPKLPIRELEIA
jgi:hypothetical protein